MATTYIVRVTSEDVEDALIGPFTSEDSAGRWANRFSQIEDRGEIEVLPLQDPWEIGPVVS